MNENSNNDVDFSRDLGYNVNNHESNVEIFKMDEHAPINDSQHDHQLVADPDDTIGDAVYHGCIVPKCGIGFYIHPEK